MESGDSCSSVAPKCPGKVSTADESREGVARDATGPKPGSGRSPRSQNGANRPQRRRAATADSATQEDQCHPRKIFIGGLAHKTTTQYLRDYFAKYGAIVDAVVLRWPDGRSRGFGYVTFAEAQGAFLALQEPHQVGGRQVDVKRAVPGTNKLFVGGLPQNTTALELRDHFEAFGVVSDAVVMIDPATNRSRGFGFVCFLPGQEGAASAAFALEQYENHRIRGKWIEVKSAAPPHKLTLAKEGSTSPTSESGTSAGGASIPQVLDVPAPVEVKKGATVMSLAAALKVGPQTMDRPVASPQHRRQPRSFPTAPLEPQKVTLPGTVGTPPGLGATAAAAAAAMSAMALPPGLGRETDGLPEASLFGIWPSAPADVSAVWGPPSCLSLSSALAFPTWKAESRAFPSDERSSVFATSSDLQRSLEQFVRLTAQGKESEIMQI